MTGGLGTSAACGRGPGVKEAAGGAGWAVGGGARPALGSPLWPHAGPRVEGPKGAEGQRPDTAPWVPAKPWSPGGALSPGLSYRGGGTDPVGELWGAVGWGGSL